MRPGGVRAHDIVFIGDIGGKGGNEKKEKAKPIAPPPPPHYLEHVGA